MTNEHLNPHGAEPGADDDVREAEAWVEGLRSSGERVDPDRVWARIVAELDLEAPVTDRQGKRSPLFRTRSLPERAFAPPVRALRRAARFATVTDGGWGGPLVVGLFAVLVIAVIVAARSGHGTG